MKKKRVLLLTLALTGVFILGAAASSAAQQIAASLRPDISVTVDGVKQSLTSQDGASVYPISYNGTTYLPVRALSEALGKNVGWDQKTQTVILTTPGGVTGATPDKPATSTGSSTTFDSSITALSARVDALEKNWSWDTYRTLDWDIEALDDDIERAYRAGNLTREQYRTLDDKLDRVDNRLDNLEDRYDWDD